MFYKLLGCFVFLDYWVYNADLDSLRFFFLPRKSSVFRAFIFPVSYIFQRRKISGHLRSETDAEREERPLVFITRAVKVFCFWVSASRCFGSSACIS